MPARACLRSLPVLLWIAASISGQCVFAQPSIRTIDIRGLRAGQTTTITIDGAGLLPAPKLLTSAPVSQQVLKPNPTAARVVYDVTVDGKAVAGLYNLWLSNTSGVSNKMIVAVDSLPQLPFADTIETLPVALHGTLAGSTTLATTFSGQAGQRVTCEVESQRMGGALRSVLHLYGPSGRQLAWSLPTPQLFGDTRLEATLPVAGEYRVTLHDLQYAAPAPNHFRLKIGQWTYADLAFPPAVQRGKTASLELIGSAGDAQPPAAIKSVQVVGNTAATAVAAPWPAGIASGFRPVVTVSDISEAVEDSNSDKPQSLPPAPVAVSGRIVKPLEEDLYQIPVKAGQKLRFEVFSERLGTSLDGVLELRKPDGARLAAGDDASGSVDPRLDYTVPANLEQLVVALRDVSRRGSPRFVYRIVVTPLSGPGANPSAAKSFDLTVETDRHSVPAEGIHVFKVSAKRRGYEGPIKLSFAKLPTGVTIVGGEIAAGAEAVLVTLRGAAADASAILSTLVGTSADGTTKRTARDTKHPLAGRQPWLENELALSLVAKPAVDFGFALAAESAKQSIVLGGKLVLPVSCARPVGFDGPVRLTVLTSQLPPRAANGTPDANRTLRAENAAFEIAVDAKAQAAWNAKQAADKVVTAAQTRAAQIAAAQQKAVTAVEAALKPVQAALATAQQKAEAAKNAAVTAAEGLKAAAKALADAQEKAKAAKNDEEKAATAAAVKQLTAKRDQAAKADTAARTAATAATTALATATRTLTAAEAKVTAAKQAAAKANADATAAVKAAQAKVDTALKAAQDAAAAANNKAEYRLAVPVDLPESPYQLTVKAELLSRDKRTVLARQFGPVLRLAAINPILVQPQTTALSAALDPNQGATLKLAGKIVRRGGMAQDVVVTMAGLPAGVAVPKVTVKADQTDYALELKFTANFKPQKLDGVKVFASGKMDPKSNQTVKSAEVELAIEIIAGAPTKGG